MHRLRVGLAPAILVGGLLAPLVPLAAAPHGVAGASPQGVVISEFRFRGPSGGNDEFVELANASAEPVDISGWKLLGCSSTATTGTRATVPAGVVLASGQRFLFTGSAAAGYSGPVPGDATYGTGISDDGGARVVTAADVIVDTVGSSASACREGAGLTIPTSIGDNAFERIGGVQDTDDNAVDLSGPKAANPQNRGATVSRPPTGGPSTTGPTPAPPTTAPPTTAPPTTAPPTTAPPGAAVRIGAIQGASHISPLAGSRVDDVPGVVTARRTNGFYIQDEAPDADPATSEGVFVFTGTAPPAAAAVGQRVLVDGTVSEFRPGGSAGADNLSTTQISGPTTTAIGAAGVITPTVIGADGRVPPTEVIEDDAPGDIEAQTAFDPASDGIDFFESIEGMLATVADAVAVGPTSDFGEIPVVSDGAASVRSARGGVVVREDDFNPERIITDDTIIGAAGAPAVDVGDRFGGSLVGVVDYGFGNFELLLTAAPTVTPGGLTREVTTDTGPNQLAVATFNVENLDPGDGGAKFGALAAQIVGNLRSPDLIALEEVQDDNGATNDAVVDATATYDTLIAAIHAAGGPAYQFRQVNPVDDQDGGEPGGNIRVGFLFRTDRGLAFVDRPGGGPIAGNSVNPDGSLAQSPGRVDPANPAFTTSRKPLAGEFTYNGERLIAVANHFNSKGGDEPLFGRSQPPDTSSEARRREQAAAVAGFVRQVLAADNDAKVLVLGDLNDFEFSDAVGILEGEGLTSLIETRPVAERYTYVFEGNSQVLDHIMVSPGLLRTLAGYDVVHANAEFADQVSDHDPQVARFALPARKKAEG